MEDKIIFLGTAGDNSTIGKQLRASGGIILNISGMQFHLDPGPGSLVRAVQYNVNLRNNTALLVSNASINRSNDLNTVIDAMTVGGLDRKGVLITNNTVVNGDEKFDNQVTKLQKKFIEKMIVLNSGQKAGIEDVEVLGIPTVGADKDGLGFSIISPNSVITYSGDTAYDVDVVSNYKDSDILILNMSNDNKMCLSIEDVVKIVNKIKPKLAILTHFGLDMLKADPLYEARSVQRDTGIQTIAAKDGMVINTGSFSTKIRQRTLNSFSDVKISKGSVKPEVREIEIDHQVEKSNNHNSFNNQ